MNILENLNDLKKKGNIYKREATKWLLESMQTPSKTFVKVNPNYLRIGAFYFIKYDLKKINKSSKMEQFVPMLLVDYKPLVDSRVFYAINFNFLTTVKKEAFFLKFMERYEKLLEENEKKSNWLSETPLYNISYSRVFSDLLRYGFDYSIREFRVELIEEVYGISTNHLPELISLDTQIITGVDEAKLNDIWIAKLKNEGLQDRMDELYNIKNNYEELIKELKEKFRFLDKKLGE